MAAAASGFDPLRRALGATRGMKIASARPVNNGRQVDIEFVDRTAYRFPASWIKDSNFEEGIGDIQPAKELPSRYQWLVADAKPLEHGSRLLVHFRDGDQGASSEEYLSTWLHAFAPHVGCPLHGGVHAPPQLESLKGPGSHSDRIIKKRNPWGAELDLPRFDAILLACDESVQLDFLEKMINPGVALISGVEPPESLKDGVVGAPLERLVGNILGRLDQHPARGQRRGAAHAQRAAAKLAADREHAGALSVHAEQSVHDGSLGSGQIIHQAGADHDLMGYIHFVYQAQGSVTCKVSDGLALAAHVSKRHPEPLRWLRSAKLIEFDDGGRLERVAPAEACELPAGAHEGLREACRLWAALAEHPRFARSLGRPEHAVVAANAWRVLRGPEVPGGTDSTTCCGFVAKDAFESRYRLLRRSLAPKKSDDDGRHLDERGANRCRQDIGALGVEPPRQVVPPVASLAN